MCQKLTFLEWMPSSCLTSCPSRERESGRCPIFLLFSLSSPPIAQVESEHVCEYLAYMSDASSHQLPDCTGTETQFTSAEGERSLSAGTEDPGFPNQLPVFFLACTSVCLRQALFRGLRLVSHSLTAQPKCCFCVADRGAASWGC